MTNGFYTLILFLGAFSFVKETECQLGIVFSPFVQPIPERAYGQMDVKVMLSLLENDTFHHVSTYGVGAPDELYKKNYTRYNCTSLVHTAVAAAELNKMNEKHVISVYQGLSSSGPKQRLNSEIEVGFEVAEAANKIYEGTVPAIIFPSSTNLSELLKKQKVIKAISKRSRAGNMKIGVRLNDCSLLSSRNFRNAAKIIMNLYDFIICKTMPTEKDYSLGSESFMQNVIQKILEVDKVLNQSRKEDKMAVMLETGWPNGSNRNDSSDEEEMKKLWEFFGQWAKAERRGVFMHEAFDNPEKQKEVPNQFLAEHYGLWKHLGVNNEHGPWYARKVPEIKTHNIPERNSLRIEL